MWYISQETVFFTWPEFAGFSPDTDAHYAIKAAHKAKQLPLVLQIL